MELSDSEAAKLYDCLKGEMKAGYAKSGSKIASWYQDWKNFATSPYISDTHGGRFVNNYANAIGEGRYGKYEDAGRMPVGSVLAKDSFSVKANGKAAPGPLFLMEKMPKGFNAGTGNWKYTMILPNGRVLGTTNGKGSANVAFCADCHNGMAEDQDYLFFLPEEYRR